MRAVKTVGHSTDEIFSIGFKNVLFVYTWKLERTIISKGLNEIKSNSNHV